MLCSVKSFMVNTQLYPCCCLVLTSNFICHELLIPCQTWTHVKVSAENLRDSQSKITTLKCSGEIQGSASLSKFKCFIIGQLNPFQLCFLSCLNAFGCLRWRTRWRTPSFHAQKPIGLVTETRFNGCVRATNAWRKRDTDQVAWQMRFYPPAERNHYLVQVGQS